MLALITQRHSKQNTMNHHRRRHTSTIQYDDESESLPPTIRVIAPATLKEGYTFDVLVDNEPFRVKVPRGGVKEGQEFEVLYDREEQEELMTAPLRSMSYTEEEGEDEESGKRGEDDTDAIWYDQATGAPIGKWRHPLCRCCDVVTQSTFWMGWCCTPILIAQLITRFQLTWDGRKSPSPQEASLSFNRVVITFMIALGIWKVPLLGELILFFVWIFFVVRVGSRVRAMMRRKYKLPSTLPTQFGNRIEDGCCMTFCGCCAIIQMARHTHDDKEFPGHGCTTTGLSIDAPQIVKWDT